MRYVHILLTFPRVALLGRSFNILIRWTGEIGCGTGSSVLRLLSCVDYKLYFVVYESYVWEHFALGKLTNW